MGLRCLGDWQGHDGHKYLALWDPEVTTDNQPRYRCAVSLSLSLSGRQLPSYICIHDLMRIILNTTPPHHLPFTVHQHLTRSLVHVAFTDVLGGGRNWTGALELQH